MYTLIYIVHLIVSILLILFILLQLGQMGGFGGIFGGGSADQIFSSSTGSIFLKKVTIVIGIIFVITTLGLTVFSNRVSIESIMLNKP